MVLVASDVHKEYGHRQVLANINVGINPGDRVALVGANGAGKSTLLRILAGVESPDDGKVSRGKHDELGYLPQSLPTLEGSTIEEVIATSVAGLRHMELRMRELEHAMTEPDCDPAVLEEYGDISSHFESRGGYELQAAIGQVLAGLGVGHLNTDRPISQLSGGEKARVGLAALLLAAPDVLLLDEPTNDLDEAALGWLQGYLTGYRGGIMMVSHDRDFIDAVCTALVELDENTHQLTRYEGNYEKYLQAKAAGRARAQQAYDVQQEEIRMLKERAATTARAVAHGRAARDNDKYLYNFKGSGVERAVSRNVRAAREQLERIEANLLQPPPDPLRFRAKMGQGRLSKGDLAIDARHLTAAYPPRVILDDVTCALNAGDRICLIGPNGAGKSTLLRILARQTQPDSGEVVTRRGLRIGYLPQEPNLPAPHKSVAQNVILGLQANRLTNVGDEARGWLIRWGLITREDLAKPMRDLSVGQQRKVEIGILIGSDSDVLLLDEPTNHLSFDVIESLQEALLGFGGPVLIVTHDRRLIRQFPSIHWEIYDGKLLETAVERDASP